jgi:putative CocE/NonD family hydrolase
VVALHAEGSEGLNRPIKLVCAAAILTAAVYLPLNARASISSLNLAQEQARSATVHGVVTDPTGTRISGASVEFLWDKKYTVQTNADGKFTIQLEPGTYDVQVQEPGFATAHQERLLLNPGAQLELNFKLSIAPPGSPMVMPSEEPAPYPATYDKVKIVQAWIPMKDGTRLAVNLYMPSGPIQPRAQDAEHGGKFPAILDYLPYRKDDWTLARDWQLHSYFVRRGYVTARVDIRGTGASEGNPPDREYSDQEQQDGLEVIDWLSKQSWSNGNVGMMGISWGGFNAIQLANLHPPALKAIIAMCATEDLFHDDIHYIDGLMHVDEYELGMDMQVGITRAPDFPTDEKSLAPRFDATPWFLLYLHHQRDGAFWQRASISGDQYAAYKVPTFMIGGFLDGYRDSVGRFLERVKNAPVKALLGPWNHTFPHEAEPGPTIEWRVEATRWWDYWLKGKQNGILDQPRFEVYMRHWYPPDPNIAEIPGDWRAESSFPPANTRTETLYLSANHSLRDSAPAPTTEELKNVPSIGAQAGFWWGDLTTDQRPIDAFSLVYDSEALEKDTAILGWPKALLQVSAGAPLADWFARLSDVAPDGSVTMVTGAGQSGAQRDSPANPSDLVPGHAYSLPIELHLTSWVFQRGHRIRLAISNALWPMIWPTPFPMTTSLQLGGATASQLQLPLVPLEPAARPHFSAPEETPPLESVQSEGDTWPPQVWTETHDLLAGVTRISWIGDDASQYPWGHMKDHEQMAYVLGDAHPEKSSIHAEGATTIELSGRTLVWSVVIDLSSDLQNFYYHSERHLTENGKLIREKSWDEKIPRDHQ